MSDQQPADPSQRRPLANPRRLRLTTVTVRRELAAPRPEQGTAAGDRRD